MFSDAIKQRKNPGMVTTIFLLPQQFFSWRKIFFFSKIFLLHERNESLKGGKKIKVL